MCECVQCPECKGSGTVWFSFSGKYMGSRRCDDLDEMDECPICDGSGLIQMCQECEQALTDEQEKEEEREVERERNERKRAIYQ